MLSNGPRATELVASQSARVLATIEPCPQLSSASVVLFSETRNVVSGEASGSESANTSQCGLTFLGSGLVAGRMRGMDLSEDLTALFQFSHSLCHSSCWRLTIAPCGPRLLF